jgi:hypothetical protein
MSDEASQWSNKALTWESTIANKIVSTCGPQTSKFRTGLPVLAKFRFYIFHINTDAKNAISTLVSTKRALDT